MKNICLIALCLALVSLAACKKKPDNLGGTWTFGANTYSASFSDYVLGAFVANTGVNNPSGTLALTFDDSISKAFYVIDTPHTALRPNHTPARPGTFLVTNVYPPDSGYVYVNFSDTSATISYVPSTTSTTAVTVSMVNGRVVIDIPPVMMRSIRGDSALLAGHLIQIKQ